METRIISAFPGVGKTYYHERNKGISIDSDSSHFSWVKDSEGNNTKERNPEFPQNYINHIKEKIGKFDVIFVSSHEVVRKALNDNNIKFFMVYPDISLKEEWINRFNNRGNDEGFIALIDKNWDFFIKSIENEKLCFKQKLTKENPYITNELVDLFFNTDYGVRKENINE